MRPPVPRDPEGRHQGSMTRSPAPQRQMRLQRRWLLVGLLGVLVLLVLLYAALFSYRFVETQLGPFAPVAAVLILGVVLAIGGPWLLVRGRTRVAAVVRSLGRWL